MFKSKEKTEVQMPRLEVLREPVDLLQGGRNMNLELEGERRVETLDGSYRKARRYNALIRSAFSAPPKAAVKEAPAPAENLSYKARRKQKKESEKEYKELGESRRLVDYKEVQNLSLFKTKEGRDKWGDAKLGQSNLTRREAMKMVGRGDYSNFENLDDVMRNMIAKEALERMVKKYGLPFEKEKTATLYEELAGDMKAHKWKENDDASDVMNRYFTKRVGEHRTENICTDMLKEGGVTALLDPALRLGLSLVQKESDYTYTKEQKRWFRELDEQMSTAVMLETLKQKDEGALKNKISEEFRNNRKINGQDAREAAEHMVEADKAQKIQIAKRLLLMHMGDFKQVNEDGESDWNKPVAVALSHCSRVTLTMPECPRNGEKEYQDMWDSIFYQKGKTNLAQDNRRAASTHSIEIREKDARQTVVEKKVPFNLRGQRGMNVAIGGLGNQGVSGKMILNDGSCGHFYSMYKEGDTEHYGAILMGLESDSPGMTNQLGHTHTARATAEKASSLGGQRTDEVGKKYGGRQCNLSKWSPQEITECMQLLEDAIKTNAPGIDGFMEKLVGPPMPEYSRRRFLGDLKKFVSEKPESSARRSNVKLPEIEEAAKDKPKYSDYL